MSRRAAATLGLYARAVVPIALAASLAALLRDFIDLADVSMMFLVGIAAAATTLGRGPSVFASVLAVAVLDFGFVPPFFTFKVDELRHVLTFAVMLCAGIVISSLAERIRRQSAERAKLAEEAEAARARAEAEEMRSSLLSSVSHDLRTPLGTILGAATTLLDGSGALGAEERTELTENIRDEASRLARLVSNLLDMSRVDSPRLEVQKEWVPVEELVGAALSRLDARLGQREVRIRVAASVLVRVDPVLFDLVVVNLLENVLKHTPEGSEVEILASSTPSGVTIEVADRGPGLPAGAEERIFEKFVRVGRGGGGVGLGLAICRGIVHAHGGTITAHHRDGGGARFVVVLPRDGEPPALPAEAVSA